MSVFKQFLFRFQQYRDAGLLILRIGIGIMFLLHGYPKLFGGPEKWARIGEMGMGSVGIESFYPFWGFIAASSEFAGGILLILGLFFLPALVFLCLTMFFAAIYHFTSGSGSAYHAIESGILFFSLIIIGPGKYSLDVILFSENS